MSDPTELLTEPATTSPESTSTWPARDTYPGDPERTPLVYRGVVRWGACVVRGYYDLEVRGEEFPDDAPALLVQNHTNGLCDAHILMSAGRRPIRILVKYKLMTTPLFGWMLRKMDAVPMYRKKDGVDTRQNQKSFEAIDQALGEGSVIALFPEGESLNSIGLRELRSGVARMAISAEESREGGIGMKIIPLGVTYEDRDRYRSRASAVLAAPIDVAEIIKEAPAEAPRRAIKMLMNAVVERLQSVMFSATSQEEYDAVVALERLLPSDEMPLGLRRKRAAELMRADDSAEAEQRAALVTKMGQSLATARLTGDDILAPRPSFGSTWLPLLWLTPLAMLGGVFMLVPMVVATLLSRLRKTPDKLVTLRVTFTYVFAVVWALALAIWWGVAYGFAGVAAAALGFAVVSATRLWPRTMDGLLAVRGKVVRRALEAPSKAEEITALREGIQSIRSRYGAR